MNLASITFGTTTIPVPHLAGNALALAVWAGISFILWHWGDKMDNKLVLIGGNFTGLILATTSLGPHLLTWVSKLTNGYLA